MPPFKGDYKFGHRFTDSHGVSHAGFIRRDFKKTWHVFVGGKERFIKRRVYPIFRHD